MIEDWPTYSQMRETGQPWLPSIPSHWDVRRNGRLFSERRETGYPDLPILEVSLRSGVRIRDMESGKRKQQIADRSVYQRAVKGDVAYNMMRMWQGAVGVAPADGLVSPAYVVALAHEGVDPSYYTYLFRTDDYMKEIDSYSRGIVPDRNRLYWQAFKQMPSAYPPFDEQRLIVRFLDWHGAMTAKLVRAKRRLIALLNEQKQSIIHRAVTRGLDPAVKVKPSGVDWLGDVPEHWGVKRLKWVVRLQRGYDLPAENRIEGAYPVVSSGGFIGHHVEGRAVAPGVVMGRYGSTDAVFYLEEDFWPHNTSLFVTDFQGNDPRWCFHMLRTISKADHSAKSAVPGVDRKDLYEIAISVPPLVEQRGVASAIDAEMAEFSQAVAMTNQEIALIQEFRTRVIADVVTGQLDARSIAANLPDVAEIEAGDDLTGEDDLDDADGLAEEDEAA